MTPTATTDRVIDHLPQTAPADEHNRTLVANTHPLDWTNPKPEGRYNLVVLGGGTAGLVTAAGAAGLGARVALIERALLGGDCLIVGCVPSKALIRCARACADVRRADQFGVRVPERATVDFPAIMERMRRLRAGISPHDSAARFRDFGIDVFIGDATFTGRNTVRVNGETLEFAKACIATGARAAEPTVNGLHECGYLTNETVFSLTELPRRLAVIGGGPIGCELAQCFARFGAKVHLIEKREQILAREDRDAAAIIEHALEKDGIEILRARGIAKAERRDGVKALIFDDDAHEDLIVDEILVGVGRAPNIENLGLETAGVEYDRSGVTVNDRLRTTNPNIFAAGDVCSAYKFTHTADALARIVLRNALFFGRAKASALTIPWCTYTDPEIAHVGLYESDARAKGFDVETMTLQLSDVDRAILEGETEGFLKVHLKKGTDRILGATLVGPHAGDMISEMTLAITAGIGLGRFSGIIHPYPTIAEVFRQAGDRYSRTRLTPFVKGLFEKWLRWRR